MTKNVDLEKNFNSRKNWLDVLRGIAIIFVVILHSTSKLAHHDKYCVFVGPIMLPLFFAISGYLFNIRNGSSLKFYKNLLIKLVVPWFALSLIWVRAILIPFKGFSPYFINHFLRFIKGKDLWYISCLIVAQIIQFYVQKIFRKFHLVCVMDIILCAVGYIVAQFNLGNIFNINKALIAQFYLMLGYIFKNYESFFSKIKWYIIAIFASLYIGLTISSLLIFPGEYIDVNRNMYPNIFLYLVIITIGVLTLFTVAQKLDLKYKILVYIGQNTLFIYAMHGVLVGMVKNALAIINIILPSNWFFSILLAMLLITICCLGSFIVNRFLPEIVGRKRKKGSETHEKVK